MAMLLKKSQPFVKTAAGSLKLAPVQDKWPSQILEEAYRQVPYLQNVAVELRLDKTDDTQGYGIGKLLLKEANAEPGKSPTVVLPVTIRGWAMDPLDVIMSGREIFPLTEEKLASYFQHMSVANKTQGGLRPNTRTGGIGQYLQPPGGGSRSTTATVDTLAGNYKLAGETPLSLASKTAADRDVEALRATLREMDLDRANGTFADAIETLLTTPRAGLDDLREAVQRTVQPDYTAVSSLPNGNYEMKTASARYFEPRSSELTRIQAETLLGPELLKRADERPVTLLRQTGTSCQEVKDVEAWAYSGAGFYKVASRGGNEEEALVCPYFSFRRGTRTGELVVLSSHGYTRYPDEKLAAQRLGGLALDSREAPRGEGFFLWKEADEWVAGPRCRVIAQIQDGWVVQDGDVRGEVLDSKFVKAAAATGGRVLLPSPIFLLCPQSTGNSFRTTEEHTHSKQAQEDNGRSRVDLFSAGRYTYTFQGNPVQGLADQQVTRDTASAVLHLLGHPNPELTLEKAAREGVASFKTTGRIYTASEVHQQTLAEAIGDHAEFPADLGFRPEIVKLALELPPERDTIDTVLALNFLNADNIRVFRGYLPELEKTASRLAELLVASRMGLNTNAEPIRLAMHYVRRVADEIRSGVQEGT